MGINQRNSLLAVSWNVTCTYSQFLAQKTPTCCVSLSSFYNDTIVNCPTCSCGCQNNITRPGSCVKWVNNYYCLLCFLLRFQPSANSLLILSILQWQFALFTICHQWPWQINWPASCPMYFPHVPDQSPLACEAQLQGLLESESHYHKLQLPQELFRLELSCPAS